MDNIKDFLKIAVNALDEKKAEDIKIIDISEISIIADYFIIANGTNPSQIHALCDNVTEKLGKAGYVEKQIEGYRNAKWILLDYKDVVINIFSKEDRDFYDLERIWADGKFIDHI